MPRPGGLVRVFLRKDRSDDVLAGALARAGLQVVRVERLELADLAAPDVALIDPRLVEGGARPAMPAPDVQGDTLEDVCYGRLAPILDRIGTDRVPDFEKAVVSATERALLRLAVERTASLGDAADLLGLHRNTVARRLEALGLRARPRRTRVRRSSSR